MNKTDRAFIEETLFWLRHDADTCRELMPFQEGVGYPINPQLILDIERAFDLLLGKGKGKNGKRDH